MDPNVIVLLGEIPIRALIPGKKSKIGKLLGTLLEVPVPCEEFSDAKYPAVPIYGLEQLMKMDAAGINLLSGAGHQSWSVNGVAVQCTDFIRTTLEASDLLQLMRTDPEAALSPLPVLPDRGASVNNPFR